MKYRISSFDRFLHDYIIDSRVWMSACLASLTLFTQVILYKPSTIDNRKSNKHVVELDWVPFWLVFFEALAIYTTDRIKDFKTRHHHRQAKSNTKKQYNCMKWVKFLQKTGFVGVFAVLFLRKSVAGLILIMAHLSLGVLYAVPIRKQKNSIRPPLQQQSSGGKQKLDVDDDDLKDFLNRPQKSFRLKDIPYFKAIFVAMAVTFIVIAAPLVLYKDATTGDVSPQKGLSLIFQDPIQFCRLAQTILTLSMCMENMQDIRDIVEDWAHGTKTLPIGFGVKRSKMFLMFFEMSSFMLSGVLGRHYTKYGPHASFFLPQALLFRPIVLSINRKTPPRIVSYFEAAYCVPFLIDRLFFWLELDAFSPLLDELGGSWMFCYILCGVISANTIRTYCLSDQDTDDLILDGKDDGKKAVTIASVMVTLASTFLFFNAPWPTVQILNASVWDFFLKLVTLLIVGLIALGGVLTLAKTWRDTIVQSLMKQSEVKLKRRNSC